MTKTFSRGESIIYITSFLLRPLDDIEQLPELDLPSWEKWAKTNAQGVELGFVEEPRATGAMCRFFRFDGKQWILRNNANGEFAVNANIRHFEHAATPLIPEMLKQVDAMNQKMKEQGLI